MLGPRPRDEGETMDSTDGTTESQHTELGTSLIEGERPTPRAITALSSVRIVERGRRYAEGGRVSALQVREGRLEALVAGSAEEPYLVQIGWDGEELDVRCSCPFDWEPVCKHAVAALFAWSGAPEAEADAPIDPSYEAKVEEALESRRERGLKQPFKVTNLDGDRYYGEFSVTSTSGRSYTVEIRSLTERLNRCDCLDYETSMLGTCKHIEAVLGRIFKRAPKKAQRLAERPASTSRVMVSRQDVPTVVLQLSPNPSARVRALADEFFDAAGQFTGDLGDGFQELRARAAGLDDLIIHSDAIELSAEVLRRRRFDRRAEEVRREVMARDGRLPGLKAKLYPFQTEGAAFLAAAGRALLADDMGLGKTVQSIAALTLMRRRGEVERALIVCPASLKHQWRAELLRFTDFKETDVAILERGPAYRQELYRRRPPVLIANYELIRRDLDHIATFSPDLLVLDEAQRIKNWRTITAEAVKVIESTYAFVLTGTPIQNRLEDLYSLMQVVDRKVLGPLWQFDHHFIDREDGGKVVGYRRLSELRRRLQPVVLRREKSKVLTQLPPRVDNRFDVEMTKAQRNYMAEFEQSAAILAALAQQRPLTPEELDRLMRLMQMARMACNAAGLIDKKTKSSPKIDELGQLLDEICHEGAHKAVVFTEWVAFQQMAAAEAKRRKLDHVVLNGQVPTHKRGALIERFFDDPDCKVFFTTDAGGVGLNLQAADTVINLDLPWNPAVLEQRIGRVHRQGQYEAVNVLLVVAQNSFEARLWNVLADKRAISDASLDQSSDIDWVPSPTSCLQVATALYGDEAEIPEGYEAVGELEDEPAPASQPQPDLREPAPDQPEAADKDDLGQRFEALLKEPTEPTEPTAAEPTEPPAAEPILVKGHGERIQSCVDRLGYRLERIMLLPDGQYLAVVDQVDEVTQRTTEELGMVALTHEVVDGMSALGQAAPTAGAEVLLDRTADPAAHETERQRSLLAVARRKLTAAKSLDEAGLGAEAIENASIAMLQAARALAPTNGSPAADVPARLLWEVLVPQQQLTLEQAGLIQRAEALARAYGNSDTPAAPALVSQVLTDAHQLLDHVDVTL